MKYELINIDGLNIGIVENLYNEFKVSKKYSYITNKTMNTAIYESNTKGIDAFISLSDPKILLNKSYRRLTMAIIYHEIGHYKKNKNFEDNLQEELFADEFSIKHGYKNELLIVLNNLANDLKIPDIFKRIEHILTL